MADLPMGPIVTHRELEPEHADEFVDENMAEIYISEHAFEKMAKHCLEYAPQKLEVMGFLIGDKYTWKDKTYVVVQDAVTTEVDSTSVNVKFSEEGMGKLFGVLDDIKYDYLLIGWYHSHPGHTCFFSETDIDTQNQMFKHPYQIGVVIDPLNLDAKAFATKGSDFYQKSYSVIKYEDPEQPWHEVHQQIVERTYHPDETLDVYLTESAMEKMVKHCWDYAPQHLEVMGFLIGDKYTWNEKTYVTVLDVVTTDLDSTSVHVKFADEGFEKLFAALDEIQYEYVLVGWYHSHPGHTCFLSSTDIKTQETMFKQPYHVAIVIDPINIDIGVYTVRDKDQVDLDFGVLPYGSPQIPWHQIAQEVLRPPPEAETPVLTVDEGMEAVTGPAVVGEVGPDVDVGLGAETVVSPMDATLKEEEPTISPALLYSAYALPIVLGIFGGVAGWAATRNTNKKSSNIIMVLGIAFGLLWFLLAYTGLMGAS